MRIPKVIDLEPSEWSAGPLGPPRKPAAPREPFWGDGLPGAIAYLSGYAITATAVYFVLH